MKIDMSDTKSYIITLKWHTWRKRVALNGEDSPEAQKEFREALKEIEQMGDRAQSWDEFLSKAIAIFKSHNFQQFKL